MAERISNKVIGYLEKYPEFLTEPHSASEARNLFRGYFKLVQEQTANPQLAQILVWRSLELTARKQAQQVLEKTSLTFRDKPPSGFPHFEFDPERRQVIIDGKPKFLAPSLFATLLILNEHPGEVITTQDLARELEKRRNPQDHPQSADKMPTQHIPPLIQRLRKTLGDNVKPPRYIETVPRLGYRLIAHLD